MSAQAPNQTQRKMTTHLFRPNPSELRVRDEVVPGLAHVLKQRLYLLALDPLGNELDGVADL